MRAGKLDRTITIQRFEAGEPDEGGAVNPSWADVATLRAQILQSSTEEFLAASGEHGESAIVFRTRFRPDVTTGNRIQFEGRTFDIKETTEIGRRQGLELRAEAAEENA